MLYCLHVGQYIHTMLCVCRTTPACYSLRMSGINSPNFQVPSGWTEKPTSIADLGGTEIDLRYTSENDVGTLSVVLAPIARFSDIEYNSDIRLDKLTTPDRLILGKGLVGRKGFARQLFLFGLKLENTKYIVDYVWLWRLETICGIAWPKISQFYGLA